MTAIALSILSRFVQKPWDQTSFEHAIVGHLELPLHESTDASLPDGITNLTADGGNGIKHISNPRPNLRFFFVTGNEGVSALHRAFAKAKKRPRPV
jgi:hypothetical protein